MYCKECGREIPAGEDVCPFCGQSVEINPAKQREGKYYGMFSVGLAFLSPLFGIIFGSVGLSKAKKAKYKPGMVLSAIGLVFSCLMFSCLMFLLNLFSPIPNTPGEESVNAIAVAISPIFLLFL